MIGGGNSKGRHAMKQRGRLPQNRRQPPKFIRCSIALVSGFLLVVVATYAITISFFLTLHPNTEPGLGPKMGSPFEQVAKKEKDQKGRKEKEVDPFGGEKIETHVEPVQNGNNKDAKIATNSTVKPLVPNEKVVIGVASTVTGCGTDLFVDGAAVMKYSLEKQSLRAESKFEYKTYIFYHPNAKKCVLPLKDLGFTLLERPTPVNVEEIEGDDLRERIADNGCCGEVRRFGELVCMIQSAAIF